MVAPEPPADTGELSSDRNIVGVECDSVGLLGAHFSKFLAMPPIVPDEVSVLLKPFFCFAQV